MYLTGRVVVTEEHAGEDGDNVLFIVDVRDGCDGRVGVEVIGEGLISDAWEAEADEGDLGGGEMEREIDGVEEGDRRACGRRKYDAPVSMNP